MCGIAGFALESEEGDPAIAESLLGSLAHRGPDGGWRVRRGGYGLVQTRLAVVDLSDAVVYPLGNEAGDVWLLFNGEIYDHASIRRELQRRGHQFRTGCDAEVVVHGYEEWGVEVFSRLNGMFAAALIDDRRGDLVLARDQFGIKPLTRTVNGRFAFASEAMALVRAGLSAGFPDTAAISEYAAWHYLAPPKTGIADLMQVEPGSVVIRARSGEERVVRFGERPFGSAPCSRPVDTSIVDAALGNAVERQLQADVEVGVLLSSGVDSSLILSHAVDCGARPVAYTLSFSGYGDYDESSGAAAIARALGVPHATAVLETDFASAVEGVGAAYDQPFADSSAIATLQLSALARRSSTVVLSGTGGDELFGGYYRTRAHRLRFLARMASLLPSTAGSRLGTQQGARSSVVRLFRSYAARLGAADSKSNLTQYLSLAAAASGPECLTTFREPVQPARAAIDLADRLGLSARIEDAPMQALQDFELSTYLPGDLLTKEDRASMSVGLEARVPFLDQEVTSVAGLVPIRQRASLLRGKRVLRGLARGHLASRSVSLTKRGFAVPLGDLFGGAWRDDATDWLHNGTSELVDARRLSSLVRASCLSPSEAWAQIALIAWERELNSARRAATAVRA